LEENRIIVKYGLEAMQNSSWPGLNLLMESAGIDTNQKLGVADIGFKIGPRINAAGRIDHPYHALQMLLHEGDIQEGKFKASRLEKLNQERQRMVQIALEEAELQYADYPSDRKIFIAWSPDWHAGILGLICSKMVEKYGLPTIAMQAYDDHLVASFRSNAQLNAVEALNHAAQYLEHYGGHAQAAGFSLKKDNLDPFMESLFAYAADVLEHHTFEQELRVDAILEREDINENFIRLLSQMEPFGVGNEKPVFVVRQITMEDLKTVGRESQHLHFQSNTGLGRFSSIAFKHGNLLPQLNNGAKTDLALHLEKNVWNGRETIQFQILDFLR
jgi:single-stranded-DNA-specific exonuclease